MIADSATLDLSTGMTLEAWVSPTSAGPNWRTVLFKETSDGTAYSLYASERTAFPSDRSTSAASGTPWAPACR